MSDPALAWEKWWQKDGKHYHRPGGVAASYMKTMTLIAWMTASIEAEKEIERLRAELRTYTGDGHNTKGEPCTQNTPS